VAAEKPRTAQADVAVRWVRHG